jgi:SAM-dependent MidA family methyltransferase
VETSHPLRSVQEQALKPLAEKFGWSIQWHDNLDAIVPKDEQYTMVLAHEFFDALPLHLIEVSFLRSNKLRVSPDRRIEISKWMARDQD